MSCVRVLVHTNLTGGSIPGSFLKDLCQFSIIIFQSELENTAVEIIPGIQMMRAGSQEPMVNISVYHNQDKLDKQAKVDKASRLAEFIAKKLTVKPARVLVLFTDTRKC